MDVRLVGVNEQSTQVLIVENLLEQLFTGVHELDDQVHDAVLEQQPEVGEAKSAVICEVGKVRSVSCLDTEPSAGARSVGPSDGEVVLDEYRETVEKDMVVWAETQGVVLNAADLIR